MPIELRSRVYREQMACVYRFYDRSDVLLYVGSAYDFDVRFKAHAQRKRWWSRVAHKDVIWFDNKLDAMYEESRAIAYERPAYNDRPGLHPVAFAVVWHCPRRGDRWFARDYPVGQIVTSAWMKREVMTQVSRGVAHAVVLFDGQEVGVLVPPRLVAQAESLGLPVRPTEPLDRHALLTLA